MNAFALHSEPNKVEKRLLFCIKVGVDFQPSVADTLVRRAPYRPRLRFKFEKLRQFSEASFHEL